MAANSAAYYGDPENTAQGELKNTPVSADSPETQPVPAPADESFIPPANPAGTTMDSGLKAPASQSQIPPANRSTTVVVDEPAAPAKAPAIPADPTKAPEK